MTSDVGPATGVVHRLAEPADAADLLDLFGRTKAVIDNLAHPVVYRAIVADALARRRSLIVVTEDDRRLVAFAVIAWDWHRFRIGFVLRHPQVALLLVARRLRRRRTPSRPKRAAATTDVPPPTANARRADRGSPSWRDGGATIAKVLYTAVDPAMRRRGIATGLKAFYVDELRRQGFQRVDAMSSRNNAASLALQRASGWVMTPKGAFVFAYLELADRETRA